MGQIQSNEFLILDDLNHLINEKIIDNQPEIILEMIILLKKELEVNQQSVVTKFNTSQQNWKNITSLLVRN
jgi:hypothetical protein